MRSLGLVATQTLTFLFADIEGSAAMWQRLVTWGAGRMLGLRGGLPTLIGVGTGICGASAIAATTAVIGAAEVDVAYAISTIFAFNIVAVLLYPAIGHLLGLSQHAFGLWSGTAINDTSSVGGVFLTWRWPRIIWVQLPAMVYGALIEFVGFTCPLTPLQNYLMRCAGEAGYSGGFISHYLIQWIYPAGLTRGIQIGLGLFVLLIAAIGYGGYLRRHGSVRTWRTGH